MRDFSSTVPAGHETPSTLQLQSKELEEILDIIDQLRSGGTDRYVDVPQIIVCGDQSSGKSSVLGALSAVSFPWRDSLCTRFAIELVLRRASNVSMKVSIHPDNDRSTPEKERLQKFQSPTQNLDQFSEMVQSAEKYIDLGSNELLFSKDVLRVEVSGPTQPHLTLVDLPGLYHAADEKQDDKGVQFVEELVWSYMQKPRSIILAVVSAKNEIALQKVTSFTRKVDPKGERTMGIITKPDTLSENSEMEQAFLKLARNERLHLGLGWHVLKNRSFEERDFSISERHEAESKFFSRGVWSKLSRSQVGIDSLRPKLSLVLKHHILSQLSGFSAELRTSLASAESDLKQLGLPRGTVAEQRQYLLYSSERFTALIGDALGGTYFDPFFGDAMSDAGFQRRLRAVIQDRLLDFSNSMSERGEDRKIVDDKYEPEEGEKCITRADLAIEVRQRMRRSRGKELPGTFNPLIIGELFYLQSRPWQSIVDEYIDLILQDVRAVVMFILEAALDEPSIEGLLRHVLNHSLGGLEQALRHKTMELLNPQQRGHPITYNNDFTENVKSAQRDHRRKLRTKKLKKFLRLPNSSDTSEMMRPTLSIDGLLDALTDDEESDMDQFSCLNAIDCMSAYYKVARKKFVDDFSNLAVELCLLEPLARIYSPGAVQILSDEVVEDIARENDNTKLERARLEEQVRVLQMSLQKLSWFGQPVVKASETFDANGDDDTDDGDDLHSDGRPGDLSSVQGKDDHDVQLDQVEVPVAVPVPLAESMEDGMSWSLGVSSSKKKKSKHARAAFFE